MAKSIWVVTKPTEKSISEDLYFEADGRRLELQFKGGLKGDEIDGFYFTESEARTRARQLMANAKGGAA